MFNRQKIEGTVKETYQMLLKIYLKSLLFALQSSSCVTLFDMTIEKIVYLIVALVRETFEKATIQNRKREQLK